MGNKINPLIYRVQRGRRWYFSWFCEMGKYADYLMMCVSIKKIIRGFFKDDIMRVYIDVLETYLIIRIYHNKPGMLIGRGGRNINAIKEIIKQKIKRNSYIMVKASSTIDALAISEKICKGIDRKLNYRRVINDILGIAKDCYIRGLKIKISGRIRGGDVAKSEVFRYGQMSLNSINEKIDYLSSYKNTKFGIVGIKVWVCF
ncbi:30S ribosomal protein S3 [Candidatus Vidania fulgoroideorum]